MVPALVAQLSDYKAAVRGFVVDHKDTEVFTTKVLLWWANHAPKLTAWAAAARIVFSFTPNSAAAERVFSLLYCSNISLVTLRGACLHLQTSFKPLSCCV